MYFHKMPKKEYNRTSSYFQYKHYATQSPAAKYLWTPLSICIGMVLFWMLLNFLYSVGERNNIENQLQTPAAPTQEIQRNN